MFEYIVERLETRALELTYHLAPWDQPVFEGPTAAIGAIRVKLKAEAAGAFEAFQNWCLRNRIKLVSCRLGQHQLTECGFLESKGLRFIELNYRPTLSGLDEFAVDPEIDICEADLGDTQEISAYASEIFSAGRLHVDPQVGPELGNRRYGRLGGKRPTCSIC